MQFDENCCGNYKESVDKFWGRIYEMIAGPDHQYAYMKRIIKNYKANFHNEYRKGDKAY